ncbi:phospholipid carrier-dependent glycosyltransferase [Xanthocytophaga agilis]|uniref:Phospholipid carrier-dependent glycosyltransferase n=1 Tax=Xanthocytophaga agilis TaxID=3048010 RepID=A0AAE3UIX9_9BACT|nr:phospholipid carrier-dependent glycosyltransferase [Xanthocytophaga agilis]MDJ1505981.1 phospholipid carrier-dependent glycosyltransferase [Xanthocytophaga agilis]
MKLINKLVTLNSLITGFFLIYLFVGIFSFTDYGISFDEKTNRMNGLVSAKYTIKKLGINVPLGDQKAIPDLYDYKDQDYGVIFDLPMLIIEKLLKCNVKDSFRLRHFFTFLIFFISTIYFYKTAILITNQRLLALLVTLFLIVSPRIFAESFYNSKDIVCLAFFIITTYYLLLFSESFTLNYCFWLSLFTSMAICTRVVALMVPLIIVFVSIQALVEKKYTPRKILLNTFICLSLILFFSILFWPFLWEDPFSNIATVFKNMKQFRWKNSVLYMGMYVPAGDLPKHYIPVYILITTPILYSLFFFLGIGESVIRFIKDPKHIFASKNRTILILLALFTGPLLAIIILDSVVYDGWRQLYFIYGAYLLIALKGIQWLYAQLVKNERIKWISLFVLSLVSFNVCYTIYWMIKNHPYQNVYFNTLAGRNIEKNFERDYWGLSYKQALEYIVAHDSSSSIHIICNLPPGITNTIFLDPKDKSRISIETIDPEKRAQTLPKDLSCDYFITEFRYISDPTPFYKELFSVNVDDFKVVAIYDGKSLLSK